MSSTVHVAILGAAGRMGRSLLAALDAEAGVELVGAFARAGHAALGADAGAAAGVARRFGVALSADRAAVLARAEVALDFTLAEAAAENARACAARGCALLVGSTGLDRAAQAALAAASAKIAVLVAPNTSLGVALLAKLAAEAAAALPADYDIEILESHHRDKRDAPSGTARRLGEAIAAARGAPASPETRVGARIPGSIGYASLRGGDLAGDHTVLFLGPGERIELSHRAQDRGLFARGALRAARWLKGRPPGLYSMADVLGFG